jgi:LysM repeat protein
MQEVSPGWERLRTETAGRGVALPANDVPGLEFSIAHIRIHADDHAARLCDEVSAVAFTFGDDIYFSRGSYAPRTSAGRRLLVHELAHTQQRRPFPFLQRQLTHRVTAAETLYSIARRYGVTVDELRAANHLAAGATLRVGTVLHIPPIRHTVAADETLYSIARRYGVSVAELQHANRLGTSTTIREHQVLTIPRQHMVAPAGQQAPAPPPQPAPPQPRQHIVGGNDTLYSIARRYGVTVTTIQAANGLGASTSIHPGQSLVIPATQPAQPAQPAAPQPAPPQPAPSAVVRPGHLPGQDYEGGETRERSFLRQQNRTTIQTRNGHRVFFASGAQVRLVAVHPTNPEWIQVTGPAYEVATPPRLIADAQGQPLPQTGWIQRRWTTMSMGVYRDLTVTDRTSSYYDLSSGNLAHGAVQNIVLHQTDSRTQQSTLDVYQQRIRASSHIGAQYLIGETGEISLVVPADRRVGHVAPDLPSGANTHVTNATSIGIEHVGLHRDIAPAPPPPGARATRAQQATWAVHMARVRADVRALPLSPPLRARLLALNDRQLFQTMRDNAWSIYPDISSAQRRSTFLLTGRLRSDFGLGLGDIYAHEHVQQKTIGEGENIRDFLVAMESYASRVRAMRTRANARPDLQRSVAFMSVLQHEESLVQAIGADATTAENATLAAERRSGRVGAATARENLRIGFYDDFWSRVDQLTRMLALIGGANGNNLPQIEALAVAWRR